MAKFNGIMKLTEAQFQTLSTNGTITVDGVTYIYDPNGTLYVTDDISGGGGGGGDMSNYYTKAELVNKVVPQGSYSTLGDNTWVVQPVADYSGRVELMAGHNSKYMVAINTKASTRSDGFRGLAIGSYDIKLDNGVLCYNNITNNVNWKFDDVTVQLTGEQIITALETANALNIGKVYLCTADSTTNTNYKAGRLYLIGGSSGAYTTTDVTPSPFPVYDDNMITGDTFYSVNNYQDLYSFGTTLRDLIKDFESGEHKLGYINIRIYDSQDDTIYYGITEYNFEYATQTYSTSSLSSDGTIIADDSDVKYRVESDGITALTEATGEYKEDTGYIMYNMSVEEDFNQDRMDIRFDTDYNVSGTHVGGNGMETYLRRGFYQGSIVLDTSQLTIDMTDFIDDSIGTITDVNKIRLTYGYYEKA